MRMRTDKLITIIFSVILGIIGLFTIYILGSSFLYDSGMLGGGDEYESLESLMEEERSANEDTTEISSADEATATPIKPSESEMTTSQESKSEEAETSENAPPEKPQNRSVQAPERTPAPAVQNPEESTESTTVKTSSSSTGSLSRKARYEELKKKFNYGTDASGSGWFVHEVWDDPTLMRNALICYVSQHGEINLATQYVGNDRLSHSQAQIQVGRNSMTTADASENDIHFSSLGGTIKERVQYRAANNKAIVDQIVTNMQQNVTVTLLGNDQVAFTLDNIDKQAIKECKEMADLLSYL